MKRLNGLWISVSVIIIFSPLLLRPIDVGDQNQGTTPASGLRYVKDLSGVVFFYEDGLNPNTGLPMPPPSIPLAPIDEYREFEFEIAHTTIPGKSLRNMLQIDLHLRQRYFYRNDGQNGFRATTNPIIEIESPALPRIWRFSFLGNGLHLSARRCPLLEGENGHESRGNFGRQIITADKIDYRFGSGTSSKFFKNDIIIRIYLENTVWGIHNYVTGVFAQIYGY
jgi:hypothetical protein